MSRPKSVAAARTSYRYAQTRMIDALETGGLPRSEVSVLLDAYHSAREAYIDALFELARQHEPLSMLANASMLADFDGEDEGIIKAIERRARIAISLGSRFQ